jgi:hypothetical protein
MEKEKKVSVGQQLVINHTDKAILAYEAWRRATQIEWSHKYQCYKRFFGKAFTKNPKTPQQLYNIYKKESNGKIS